jgi:hypothetical protein
MYNQPDLVANEVNEKLEEVGYLDRLDSATSSSWRPSHRDGHAFLDSLAAVRQSPTSLCSYPHLLFSYIAYIVQRSREGE